MKFKEYLFYHGFNDPVGEIGEKYVLLIDGSYTFLEGKDSIYNPEIDNNLVDKG